MTKRPTPSMALSLDGYIVTMPHMDDPVVALLQRRGISYVTLGRDPSRPCAAPSKRRHLLAQACRHLLETLRGRAFTPGLDNDIAPGHRPPLPPAHRSPTQPPDLGPDQLTYTADFAWPGR